MKHLTKADQKLGFNIHAVVFVMSMIAMVIINVAVGPPWWVIWPALGWSVGLLMHWWFTLGPGAGAKPGQ